MQSQPLVNALFHRYACIAIVSLANRPSCRYDRKMTAAARHILATGISTSTFNIRSTTAVTMISKRSVSAATWPRRTKQGRSWPHIAPALVGLLLITGWLLVSPSSAAKEQERSLAEVAEYLRDGDYRLVRPSPSDSTAERQHSEACGEDLERAYKVLTTEKDSKLLIDAANVVALCTTNNPKNRAKLTTSKGVPEALVAMVKTGDPASIAAAGECIWISSFNSPENFQALTNAGAVHALTSVLTSDQPCTDKCHHAKMWSAAALQNLAATYCTGDPHGSPYCEYEWIQAENKSDGANSPYKVVMSMRSKPKVDPTPVRTQLLGNENLIQVLSKGICEHLDEIENHPEERVWPSRAQVPDHTVNATIVPWAYMGLAKNLALAEGSFEKFSEEAIDCICEYAVQSPDWLEYGKAQDALWNLGLDFEEFCEPLYHDDECDDEEDFVDDDGNGCDVYEEERWCAEFGGIENSDGVTPDDACCACGGGNDMAEEL